MSTHPPPGRGSTRGFPDGSPSNRKKRSPSDRAREARRLTQRLDVARKDRRESWPEGGQDEFATARQESRLNELHGEKRVMRREIYAAAPALEGSDMRKHHPGRS